MIPDQYAFRELVVGLHEHVGVDVVPANTADRRPDYPYLSYNITSSLTANSHTRVDEVIPSENPDFKFDINIIRKEQTCFTLSINAYSEKEAEAYALAEKARDWFTFYGNLDFVDLNVAVITASNINNRTQLIADDCERRYGFDVRIRAARAIIKRVETIESRDLDGTVSRPQNYN